MPRPRPPAHTGRNRLIVGLALTAIIGSIVVVVLYIKGTTVVHNSDFDKFLIHVNQSIADERYELVTVSTNDERTKVFIKGKAPRQQDIDELRAKLDAATPRGDYEMSVTTGARMPR